MSNKSQFPEAVNITPPRFLFAPDHEKMELYIIHTQFPICVILVRQTVPVQLFIIESEIEVDDLDGEEEQQEKIEMLEPILMNAGEWYRNNALKAGGFKTS